MKKQKKSIFGAITVGAALLASVCFAGCTPSTYSLPKLDGEISAAPATSNGGFVVEKGDYVYFINGKETYTASNYFGVTKGGLMRIAKADLTAGNYGEAEMVVPMVFASQNYDSGIYIYGDYVYFATPTSDKDKYGTVLNNMLDFKRAKLDGTETMGGYMFRSESNADEFRFVEVGEGEDAVVYCMYVENGVLKSYNTKTGEKKVLVEGASSYYFDETNKENATVYYTMSVKDKADSEAPEEFAYNQIYCVTPDASATVNAGEGKYTVTIGGVEYRTYDFDESYLAENDKTFNAGDYTTYPYVNLGKLVLDGIGSSELCPVTQFNDADDYDDVKTEYNEKKGYTYTLKSYQNGGLYYTRKKVQVGEENKIYYLPTAKTVATDWNTVGGNFAGVSDIVSLDASIDSANTAIYTYEAGVHTYYYVSGEFIYKGQTSYAGATRTEEEKIKLVSDATDATLLFNRGDYLYFYKSATTNLSRINCTGDDETLYTFGEYDSTEEFVVSTMTQMEFNTDWYRPEFVGETLLYSNVKTIDGVAYNYVYAVDMAGTNATGGMTALELNAEIEKFEEVRDYMQNEVTDTAIKNAMTYVFLTGSTAGYEDVKDLYSTYQQEEIEAFAERRLSTNDSANDYVEMFKDDAGEYYDRESYFINLVGARNAEDEKTYAEGVAAELLSPEEKAVDNSFPVWAIVLISVGGGLLVAAGIATPIILAYKKKQKARRDMEATRVKKRKKIDTTDDRTIDVYGDETAEETPVEVAEEAPAETPVDQPSEAPATEETPVEGGSETDAK